VKVRGRVTGLKALVSRLRMRRIDAFVAQRRLLKGQ
jgi:hypothetical protein